MRVVLVIIVIIVFLAIVVPLGLYVVGVDIIPSSGSGGGDKRTLVRSENGGETFASAALSQEIATPFPQQISDVVFDPVRPGRVWLGTRGAGLWASDDNGKKWRKIRDTARVLDGAADIYRIAFSPGRPERLWAAVFSGNRGRIVVSDDAGRSFRNLFTVSIEGAAITDIAPDAADPSRLRIATARGEVLESENGGATWRVVHTFEGGVQRLFVDARDSDAWYVFGARGTIWRTDDGGISFAERSVGAGAAAPGAAGGGTVGTPMIDANPFSVFSEVLGRRVRAFTVDAADFDVVYAIEGDTLFGSEDGGRSWKNIDGELPLRAHPVSAVAARTPIVFVAAGTDLYRSDNGGATWRVFHPEGVGEIAGLYLDPRRSDTVFAAVSEK